MMRGLKKSTRMLSSGMCTSRLLTVSEHALRRGEGFCLWSQRGVSVSGPGGGCLWSRGVSTLVPGVSATGPGGCLPLVPGEGVSASGHGGKCIPACNGADTPPCGQTDTCENITFANFVFGR